jgi:hypothetical protein
MDPTKRRRLTQMMLVLAATLGCTSATLSATIAAFTYSAPSA